MSTPVQQPTDINPIADWEVTPVIIKTGGGTLDPETPTGTPAEIKCTIEVQDQAEDFISRLTDQKWWQSAMSAQVAGILDVTIVDGVTRVPTQKADHPGLAVVQISFGGETLIVQEVALADSDEYTNVSISSSLPFAATPTDVIDEWSDSEAKVPAVNPFVVFTQGDFQFKYQCQTTDVSVALTVDWGKMTK